MVRAGTLLKSALAIVMLSAMAVAAKEPGASRRGTGVGAARQITLDEKRVREAIPVRVARNLLTTVEFPEEVLVTKCPDCVEGKGSEGEGLFRIETVAEGRYLAITPTNVDEKRRKGEEPVTTVLVRLEHATLMLYLERVERKSAADTRVVLVYPNRESESEYLRVEKAKFEAEGAAQIEAKVSERYLRAFMEPHSCSRKGARARNDDIVLEVTEICYFGREVVLVFTVENRGRVPVEIGSVAVNKGKPKSKKGQLTDKTVEFQKVVTGVESLELPEGENSAGPFELTVSEKAGRHRVVTVGGLEF